MFRITPFYLVLLFAFFPGDEKVAVSGMIEFGRLNFTTVLQQPEDTLGIGRRLFA